MSGVAIFLICCAFAAGLSLGRLWDEWADNHHRGYHWYRFKVWSRGKVARLKDFINSRRD